MDNQDDYLLNLFRGANNPDINDILDLLTQAQRMPKMSVSSRVRGYGDYNWSTNELRIHPNGGSVNTAAHELTHALDNAMTRQYLDDEKKQKLGRDRERLLGPTLNNLLGGVSPNPSLDQWLGGYDKLRASQTKIPMPDQDEYRTSPAEMRAFGVGNINDGGNPNKVLGYNVNPHLDATMATEAAILRELYRRRLKLK